MKIHGIEGLTPDKLAFEVRRGGRFVLFTYTVSVLILTFKRPSDIYFVPAGEGSVGKGLPFSLLTLIAGWWGIPWGPIYSVGSIWTNSKGGKDVTEAVMGSLRGATSGSGAAAATGN